MPTAPLEWPWFVHIGAGVDLARFGLSTYVIRIEKRDEESPGVPLGSFEGKDLLEVLKEYLEDLATHDEDQQRLLRVARVEEDGRHLRGIVETGEYGYESDLFDTSTEEVVHHRSVDEAEMLPFFFWIEVPKRAKEGIVALQTFQQRGIRQALFNPFINWFNEAYTNHRIVVNPLAPSNQWERLLDQGEIKRVRFISYSVPPQIEDAYRAGGHEEDMGYMEIVVHAKRRSTIPIIGRVRQAFRGIDDLTQMIAYPDFTVDRVKVVIDISGSLRTLDVANPQGARALFEVPEDEVDIGSSGHPNFESISIFARKLVADIRASMGGG